MNCVGVIAEYNPFHNGHAYQLKEANRLSGADAAIACMSASFVQRGEPALLGKHMRARLAIEGGADMVIELPDAFSCACAERFAFGGVRLLAAAGLVKTLAFGSENGSPELIERCAAAELSGKELKALIKEGHSYPKAAALYLESVGALPDGAVGPNDLLAAEYLRQLSRIPEDNRPSPLCVKRTVPHDGTATDAGYASASAIRTLIQNVRAEEARPFMSEYAFETINNCAESGCGTASLERLSSPVLAKLRSMRRSEIAGLADVSEGLENPIFKAALESGSIGELLTAVKTKRYTLARLKRILIAALLGTTEGFEKEMCVEDALYIRVLAVRKERKRELLNALARSASVPVVITASDLSGLSEKQLRLYEHTVLASRLRALACSNSMAACRDFPGTIAF